MQQTINIIVKPTVITSAIEYQTGAVVSKQILKKGAGNVTLLAFDRNETLNESTSSYDLLLHVLEGTLDLKVNGTSNLLKAGEYFVLPSKIPHIIEAKEKTKILSTVIR
jgi:quercetin dioxygenase-like cupin family protein